MDMEQLSETKAQQAMGRRLYQVRVALGLSQEEMARVLGIGATTLSAWEIGRNRIDIVKLARAAARFGFTVDWIALGTLSALPKALAERIETTEPREVRKGRPSDEPRGSKKALKGKTAPAPQITTCAGKRVRNAR